MRDIKQCHPTLQELANKLIIDCKRQGYNIGISECLRTIKEQDDLYAIGRTKPGKIVTNSKGSSFSSMHQWGVAFDFYRNDGKGAYYDNDNFFTKIGGIGKKLGLEWGGDWKSIIDKPHFQLSDWGSTTTKLKTLYTNPDKFILTWNGQIVKETINVGSKVKVKTGAKTYTGGKVTNFVYDGIYTVDALSGDRAVLDKNGICTPFNINDLNLQK